MAKKRKKGPRAKVRRARGVGGITGSFDPQFKPGVPFEEQPRVKSAVRDVQGMARDLAFVASPQQFRALVLSYLRFAKWTEPQIKKIIQLAMKRK